MDDETLFGWIHLSDIHFGQGGAGYTPNQKLVLEELQRDVAESPARARVDVILVTGDVAFSGTTEQYQRASQWLRATAEAAGVAPASVFLVPGNHDVDWNVDADFGVGPLLDSLRDGKKVLDDVLAKPGGREALAKRMGAFLDAAKEFGQWDGRDTQERPDERLWGSRVVPGDEGLAVRLVGLNTAILARDPDQGRLRLGEMQLHETLGGARPTELVVALSHHPFRGGWLADEQNVDRWLRRRAHVHLSGHVHEAETEFAGSGGGSTFVRVVAGASHGERSPDGWHPARHGYNFAEVRRRGDALVLRVYPRLWSDAKKKLVTDVDGVPDGKTYAEHPLGLTLPRATGHEAPVEAPPTVKTGSMPPPRAARPSPPLPEGPLPTFISYAAADEKKLERLRVHLAPLAKRDRLIDAFTAVQVGAGEEARKATARHLHAARVILLLISADYLASDECYDVEMMTAVARHNRREALVIPILLNECDYRTAPFKELKFALQSHWTAPPKAVYGEGDPEIALKTVVDEVRAQVGKLRQGGGHP
jgi:predicted MPP superfamily phosphohydrolase